MGLILAHPEVAAVSCQQCQAWMHTDGWQVRKHVETGEPIPRRGPPPCRVCPKIPRGAVPKPENAVEPNADHWDFFERFLEVRAGAPMPDSVFFRRVAAVLAHQERLLEREKLAERIALAMRRRSP